MLWGGELLLRDGAAAGQVSSAAWGETTGGAVGLGYLWTADGSPVQTDWIKSGSYQANVGGRLVPVAVSLRAPYDPTGARVRG